jgi:hypothetical protein
MNKKSLSGVITILMVIILGLVILAVVWATVGKFIQEEVKIAEAQAQFFGERVEMSSVNFNEEEETVTLVIKKLTGQTVSRDNGTSTQEPMEADIISVVDLSGSMRICSNGRWCCSSPCYDETEDHCINSCFGTWEDKLIPTQNANKELINTLQDTNNRIGLVGYNNNIVNSASLDLTDNIGQLEETIDSWSTGGSTCLCCGINEAVSKLTGQSSEEKTKAIIVMSDGEANSECGEQGTGDAIEDAIKAACDANETFENFMIYTVGVGIGVDEETLTAVAECGDGGYFPVADTSNLVEIYQEVAERIQQRHESIHKFNYFIILFQNETDSYKEIITDLPEVLGSKRYDIDLEGKLSGEIQKIEVYPVILVSGEEVIGPLLDEWEK